MLASISGAKGLQKPSPEYAFECAVKSIIKMIEAESSRKAEPNAEFERMAKALMIVVELRHTLQHGGMPNILRKLRFKDVTTNDLASMMSPQNYSKTKEVFQSANQLLELIPKVTIVFHKNGTVTLEKLGRK